MQVAGVVLVVAMLIIPGATAYLLTDRRQRMLLIAPAVAAAVGLYLSYQLDTASGSMIVLVQGMVFALVYLFSPRHRPVGSRLTSRRNRL